MQGRSQRYQVARAEGGHAINLKCNVNVKLYCLCASKLLGQDLNLVGHVPWLPTPWLCH